MQTVTNNLQEMAENIRRLMEDLLLNHAIIYMWNEPGSMFISVGGDYGFRELSEAGHQLQGLLLDEYKRFYALLSVLLKDQHKDTVRKLEEYHREVTDTVELNHTWEKTTKAVFEKGAKALDNELNLLKHLYDMSDGETVLVPDTNALLYYPNLEEWKFDISPTFTILLLPVVLSELDALKVNHRNDQVREKTKTIINKIKEYRRRGKLTDGIHLVKGTSRIKLIAVEPNFANTLPWLTADNNDDRFLCAVVEVMHSHPRSPVIIITGDINLQNKAEFARLPFIEPPDPKQHKT